MTKFLLKIIANALAIYVASSIIEGFTYSGSFIMLGAIGLGLTIFQQVVYPVLKIVAFPLVFLSFGLFGTLLNLLALGMIAYFLPELTIDGIMPLIWGTIIISIVNILFSWL
jgi:putative membrane protein